MGNSKTITTHVLDALQRNPGCEFDRLVKDCSEFTWNQLFYEVDRLSRLGQLCVYPVGEGQYYLRLPNSEEARKPEPGAGMDAPSPSPVPEEASEPGS